MSAQNFAKLVALELTLSNDDPAQNPIGTPLRQVAIAAALLLLPTILDRTGAELGTGGSDAAASQAMSCPVFVGGGTLLGESSCAWAKASARWTSLYDTTSKGGAYRVGGQAEIGQGWFLGGFLGGGHQTLQGNGAVGSGQVLEAGLALKRVLGPWLLAGAATFMANWNQLDALAAVRIDDVNVSTYAGALRLRGAYDLAFTRWYLRPRLDLDVIHRSMPGFQVMSQGATVMSVGGLAKTSFAATPTLEIGGRHDLAGSGMVVRPYAALGASFLPDNSATFSVQFAGPLAFLGSYRPVVTGASVLANVEAGIQLYRNKGLEMRAGYTLTTGSSYTSQAANLRGAWHF
ncbi:MAG: autotransporter domain-containing protein [Pseudomonadota bacterium]